MRTRMMASYERWHVAKVITIGNLLTGILALAAIALSILDLRSRVAIVEYKSAQNSVSVLVIRQEISNGNDKVLNLLNGIGDKQYRHLEDHAKSDVFAGQ